MNDDIKGEKLIKSTRDIQREDVWKEGCMESMLFKIIFLDCFYSKPKEPMFSAGNCFLFFIVS